MDHKADYLGSPWRKHIFSSFPAREVDLSFIRQEGGLRTKDFILTDDHNMLEKWH
jgi:hypothetical protein